MVSQKLGAKLQITFQIILCIFDCERKLMCILFKRKEKVMCISIYVPFIVLYNLVLHDPLKMAYVNQLQLSPYVTRSHTDR